MATILPAFAEPVARGELEVCDLYDDLGSWYYDALIDDFRADVVEVVKAFRRHRARTVIDWAAGSGRLTLPLASRGFDVTAVDLSRAMLDRLSARLRDAPGLAERVHVVQADATGFVPDAPADAAVMGATSICLFGTGEARRALLRSVHRALRPEGVFVLDVSQPPERLVQRRTMTRLLTVGDGSARASSVFVRALTDDGAETVNVLVHPHPATRAPVLVTTRKAVVVLADLEADLAASGFEVVDRVAAPAPVDDEVDRVETLTCRSLR